MKWLLLLGVAACSLSEDYTGTVYQCGPNGECPDQYACVAGYCLPATAAGTQCAIDLAAGDDHTCAVRTDGTVWCWGQNDRGQVGDDMTIDAVIPTQVSGMTVAATAVAGGGLHTCALGSDGSVWCWGSNQHGQLGDGSLADSRAAVAVKNLIGATAIVAGDHHTCALVAGAVQCWGVDDRHQLGDATTMDHNTPAVVAGVSASAIAAGDNTTCAVGSDTRLYCWGGNAAGQLGDGTTTARGNPVAVPNLSGVVAVSIGADSTTAVLSDGSVRSFGNNSQGALGDGTENSNSSPVLTVIGAPIASSASGGAHTCAIDAEKR